MKQYRPSYYKDFRCIASACSDNCCIGWEIDIDPQTAAFYHSVGGDFGLRLQQHICSTEDGDCFILQNERCPFLNGQNLCDIFLHLGEKSLCEICTEHPRYHEWFGDWKESGLGLCCEAAGRLIFSQTGPAAFETVEIEEEAGDKVDEEAFSALFIARETAFSLVQNRQLSFGRRMALLLYYGRELQYALEQEDWCQIKSIAAAFEEPDFLKQTTFPQSFPDRSAMDKTLSFFSLLEPIDPQWPDLLLRIRKQLPEILDSHQKRLRKYGPWERELEHLTVTFLFRYFSKALFDGDIYGKTAFTVLSCCLVSLLDGEVFLRTGSYSLEDRIFTAKQYSKEIEYCTDNLDALWEAFWAKDFLSSVQIMNMIRLLFVRF